MGKNSSVFREGNGKDYAFARKGDNRRGGMKPGLFREEES